MSRHFGKIILGLFFFSCLATAVFLKQVFRDSSGFKSLATDQMRMEFLESASLREADRKISIPTEGSARYSLDLKGPWKFEIHDKTLVVFPPPLNPTPAAAEQAQVQQKAVETVAAITKSWLMDKYHNQKDLLVEVRF